MMDDAQQWQAVLDSAIGKYAAPGAVLGVCANDGQFIFSSGVADVDSRKRVCQDTTFRLGSISKLLTAYAALRVARQAGVDIDAPLKKVWPEFTISNQSAADAMTLTHLLSHRSGIFGDYLEDFGPFPHCLKKYADAATILDQPSSPGSEFSYCNAAFTLAARASEVISGANWPDLIRGHVFERFSMARSAVLYTDAPDENISASHVAGPNGAPQAVRSEKPLHVMAPAGATAITTASDLLKFAHGISADEAIWPLMRNIQTRSPVPSFANGWGRGLAWFDDDGDSVGHDGAVLGQQSFMRMRPDDGLVIVLLTNGGDGRALFSDITEFAASALGKRFQPTPLVWPERPLGDSAQDYTGCFAVRDYQVEVTAEGNELTAKFAPIGQNWDFGSPVVTALRRAAPGADDDLFFGRFSGAALPTHQRFHRDAESRVNALTFRGRYFPRIK